MVAGEEFVGADAFLEGMRLQERKEFAASIEQFRAAAAVYSLVADYSLNRMVQSALYLGDKDLAVSALEKLIRDYPDSPARRSAHVELGTLYYETGRFSKALPLIQAALPGAQSSSETAGLTLMVARILAGAGDTSRSESVCWQIIHGWPATGEALEAVRLVKKVDTPERKLAVAKVYVRNKKPREAFAVLDELKQAPEAADLLPEVLLYQAQSLAMNGQKQEASAVYQRIITEHPSHSVASTALFNNGEYNRSTGSFEQALSDYARVAERFPASALAPQALLQRAKIFRKMNDRRAYEEYEKIIQRYPKSAAAFSSCMSWGVDLFWTGDYEGARRVFQRLRSLNHSSDANTEALFWIGKSALAKGDAASAKSAFASLVEKHEESYYAFRARAVLRSLDEAAALYSQPYSAPWDTLFSFDINPAQLISATSIENSADVVESLVPALSEKAGLRLKFLLTNELPEARLEIAHISRTVQEAETRYALAWALQHVRAYNDSLRLASPLKNSLADSSCAGQVRYLLYPAAYPDLLRASLLKYEVDPLLALAVMREESHFMENAVSPSNAHGLMQILPTTGKWLAEQMLEFSSFESSDLFQPSINIELGNYYLRYLLEGFDNNPLLAVAAYNWGETNLRKWLPDAPKYDFDVFVESIPADETRKYVKKVFTSYAIYQSLYSSDWFVGTGKDSSS